MPEYDIRTPVLHDGERRAHGTIELSESEAAPLLAAGAIAPVTDAAAGEGEPHEDTGLSERELALRAALAELDASDPDRADTELWTKQGAPALPAVRRHPELSDVTRAEVDAAWAALHQAHSED